MVELLVMIAILSALFALLMPSLKKSQETALTLSCKNTTRSTSQAWHLLIEDSDHQLFGYVFKTGKIWASYFENYLEDPDLLVCPSTTVPKNRPNNGYIMGSAQTAWVENRTYTNPIEGYNRSSYTYNINLGPYNPYNPDSYQELHDISDTAGTPLLGDGWWRAPSRMYNNLSRYIPQNLDNPIAGQRGQSSVDRFITNRHNRVTVLTYVDGHSAAVPLEEVFDQNWFKGYDTSIQVQHF